MKIEKNSLFVLQIKNLRIFCRSFSKKMNRKLIKKYQKVLLYLINDTELKDL